MFVCYLYKIVKINKGGKIHGKGKNGKTENRRERLG